MLVDSDTWQQFHAYEGFPLDTVEYPIRFMAALGVQDLISASRPFVLSVMVMDGIKRQSRMRQDR